MRMFALIALLALPLAAGAEIYTWKDASGKTIYSDKPPLEKKAQTRELKSGRTTTVEPAKPATETEAAPAKADQPAGANGNAPAKSPEQLKAESDARQQLCDNARKRLIQLESSKGVLLTKDAKGQDVPLVGEARNAEQASARKDVEYWCK